MKDFQSAGYLALKGDGLQNMGRASDFDEFCKNVMEKF